MPTELWGELLKQWPDIQFELHLIGPEARPLPKTKAEFLNTAPAPRGQVLLDEPSLAIHCHTGFYDELSYLDELSAPDGFVLFNSGVGEKSLREGWMPTIRKALQSHSAMLFTSFDEEDQRNDLAALEKLEESTEAMELEYSLEPMSNPFECMKYTAHIQAQGRYVKSNALVFVVAQKRKE
jgi:hypothetical protein